MREQLAAGCLILGILCFFYYIAITLYAGLRTSIGWIWLIGGIVFLALWKMEHYLMLHPLSRLRWLTAAAGTGFLIVLVLVLAIGSRIVGSMTTEAPDHLEYVLVLGAQVKGTKPSRALRRRLDRASEYLKQNPDTILILSGGQGADEEISEALCMHEYLIENGVCEAQLLMEDQSKSTEENLIFSDERFHLKKKEIGIISNNFHIYRALKLAQKSGYRTVHGIPAASDLLMQPHNILREICCLVSEKLLGKI